MKSFLRKTVWLFAALPLVATATAAAAPASPRETKAERQLARAIEGRVAGEPVDCIDPTRMTNVSVLDGIGILYRAPGGTLYLNRTKGAERLDSWDILVTKIWGSRICENEIVQTVDRTSGMWSGAVSLAKFVPYERPGKK